MKAGPQTTALRLGIDLGGTKIAGIALAAGGGTLAEHRALAPRHDYAATIAAVAEMVRALEQTAHGTGSIGIGMPGSLSPASGLVQNANSTWLNGRPFQRDLESRLGRAVRVANDANCFALSEAVDGAGAGARSVFGVIIGTGCGGGLVFDGALIDGPRGIGGEWGHNPLPWAEPSEHPGPKCWCGRIGCIETWVSGPGLEADHARATGSRLSTEEIAARAAAGDACCASHPRPARQPARTRACARRQHLRPRGDRAGRRPLEARAPLRRAAWPGGALRVRRAGPSGRQAAGVGRCRRRTRCCVAVAVNEQTGTRQRERSICIVGGDWVLGPGDFCSHLLGGWKTISLRSPRMENSP